MIETVKIDTAQFGELEVASEGIFTFPMGLLGFARHKRFVVIDHSEDSPFKYLQSADDPQLCFIITDPLFFKADYHISLRRGELELIEPFAEEDLLVSVIMTVPRDPQDMSANLMAPLVFNMANRKGLQYVFTDQRFPVKFYVLRNGEKPGAKATPEPRSISLR